MEARTFSASALQPGSDPHSLPAADLEDEITALSASITVATWRLLMLMLIAELDRRNAWQQWGALSCAHWLNWKCGIDLGAAREKVRVARALESLPLGYHRAVLTDFDPSGRYVYRLYKNLTKEPIERSDPASRFQPDGVHGPSQFVDTEFDWDDGDW